jgi:UDP-3-O-[3-hydroxymyristoyl] N-acetylglucosamine deacetylase
MSDAATLSGVGVHGGHPATVHLHRRPGPVAFAVGGVTIPATLAAVADARARTVLATDGARVATVEHLLAALHVAGIWSDLLVEVDGPELPILDGSAGPWRDALADLAARAPFPPPPTPLAPPEGGVRVRDGGGHADLAPGATHLDVRIHFDHPAIGTQAWTGGPAAWGDLLDARTFGFTADADALRAAGLAAGASEANAILFGDDAAPVLRRPDEPVRHKALDALGDLYLLGRPFAGRLRVTRGGHALHHALARALAAAGAFADAPHDAPTQPAPGAA